MMRKGMRIGLKALTAVVALGVGSFLGLMGMHDNSAQAAAEPETVDLRIIGTTDLHGQLNSKDYEKGVDYNNGGLARLSDLIKKAKNEVPAESAVLLDAGDTLYDYTTEYIFSEDQQVVQPIYKAMATIGYDAITLGNHDFDYGYDYILRQLDGAGLRNITVLSNVTDSKTGDYPFHENMIITRTLTTSSGNKVQVKIGILGLTIPTLTGKTHSYVGLLKGEDMITNAKTEAAKLKQNGADVIVALAHTGIGPETPELNFKNVAYALTKISDIDVVICGHEHNQFPTTDYSSPYFKLPYVEKSTCLMNDKNVIMAGNRGNSLGVVDLQLTVYKDGGYRISDRKSELRMVNADTTKENKAIASFYGTWDEQMLHYSRDIIAELKTGELIHNYYGMLGDNSAIQLLNDAKIDYAQRFVYTSGAKYKDYPIIAASTYYAYGMASPEDYVNIKDSITESDLSSIQPYNNYIYIYTITGKQLKEWLEWSASAYETAALPSKWSSLTMNNLMKESGLKSLLKEEWMNDWSSFTVFDGVDYIMDPSSEPRYDISGNKVSNSSRINRITYNGKEVSDDMRFLIATNKITAPTAANRGVETQVVLNGFVRMQTILSKYIAAISDNGSILPQLDYNWNVKLASDNSFITRVADQGEALFEASPWYKKLITKAEGYSYYEATYPNKDKDTIAPHIIATQVITDPTASPYKVAVHVTDASKLKTVQYIKGEKEAEGFTRTGGATLEPDNTFTVVENGIYTIYAEDEAGNKSIYRLVVKNFDDNLLSAPTVDSYTNRKTKITGRGEPLTKAIITAPTGTYITKVSKDGTFSYGLPAQNSGSKITIYLKDETKNLESARVTVEVKRTGPNFPIVKDINNIQDNITGNMNDDDATLIAIVGDTVYVPENGGKELYMANTEIYDPVLDIVKVKFVKDKQNTFAMTVGPIEAGATVKLYSLDHIGRNSRGDSRIVQQLGPDAPVVYEISNIERSLSGIVPNTKKSIQVAITIGGNAHTVQTEKDGSFSLGFDQQLQEGEIVQVQAIGSMNGATRRSYTAQVKVRAIEDFMNPSSRSLVFDQITDKSNLISGMNSDDGRVYLAIATGNGNRMENTLDTVDTEPDGSFQYILDEKLSVGTKIYAMTRFTDGKILHVAKYTVIEGRPDKPVFVKRITNTDKQLQVASKKDCNIVVKIGSKTYASKQYKQDKENNQFIYTVNINRTISDSEVKITSTNQAGTSDELVLYVVKVAPDQPIVDAVKVGDTTITGKVELYEYIPEEGTAEKKVDKATAKRFKNAPKKVAKTQTRIFAQIGSKVYEGSIDNKGEFKIEISAPEKGTDIFIWGSNKAGRGPLIKVTVLE